MLSHNYSLENVGAPKNKNFLLRHAQPALGSTSNLHLQRSILLGNLRLDYDHTIEYDFLLLNQ